MVLINNKKTDDAVAAWENMSHLSDEIIEAIDQFELDYGMGAYPYLGLNKTEVAKRYYKKLGKHSSRQQSKKNFYLLKNPDRSLIMCVVYEICFECLSNIRKDGFKNKP